MKNSDEISQQELIALVSQLKQIPARDESAATRGRAAFLQQARRMRYLSQHHAIGVITAPPVSQKPFQRLMDWIAQFQQTIFKRRQPVMINALIAIALAFGVLLGGAGATAYAAESSLPTEPLYGLKLLGEEARLQLATQTQTQLELTLEFANRRMAELAVTSPEETAVIEQTANRYQTQMQLALQLAAGLDDEAIVPALQQVQNQLQQQQQTLTQLQTNAPENGLMTQLRQMQQEQLRLVDQGLEDPQQLRNQLRIQLHAQQTEEPVETEEPVVTEPVAPASGEPAATAEPVQNQAGPNNPETTPGAGYGPGPQNANPTPQPTAQYGPGPLGTPVNGGSQGPNPSQVPGSGSGGLNGGDNDNGNNGTGGGNGGGNGGGGGH